MKAYLPKPVSNMKNEEPNALNNSDDFDDALLDDPEDDFLCSQAFDLGDAQTSTPVPRPGQQPPTITNRPPFHPPPVTSNSRPVINRFQSPSVNQPFQARSITSRFQSPSVNHNLQPRPMNPQFSRPPIGSTTPTTLRPSSTTPQYQRPPPPQNPQPAPQPGPVTLNCNVVQQIEKPPDAKYDQLSGENSWLKDKLQNLQKQIEEEREAKMKLLEEKEAELAEFKKQSEKMLSNVQSTLEFKAHDLTTSKMKVNELERQIKQLKNKMDDQVSAKPLPYSLPIVMHRKLDFTPNKGFVDWDETVTLDDVPDIKS